ncbi:alpha/beta hydrolase [Pseudomonas sp. ME-P-057]|uniref:alpha/beta fold hydrolase n=1 Tax=Pseudomonas sp. ME-P-057 TaxID=3040321 RepID=UPI00255321C6|nr:alpha/beta hydrolase [Pseudomonas sp. ME-P-057]
MNRSSPYEGFELAYQRVGTGRPVVLIHGWPGDHTDYDLLIPMIKVHADVIAVDLRGFGCSDKHSVDPESAYSGKAQARAVIALMEELGLQDAIICGYDVGSCVARNIASMRADLVSSMVLSPPLPGAGHRLLELAKASEFWYAAFNKLGIFSRLVDGNMDAAKAYLTHFWSHWSGPAYQFDEGRLAHLTDVYSAPGSFEASCAFYKTSDNPLTASAAELLPERDDRLTTPTIVLWPENDPIFPADWSDRLAEFFVRYRLVVMPMIGHFSPVEGAPYFARAIHDLLEEEK